MECTCVEHNERMQVISRKCFWKIINTSLLNLATKLLNKNTHPMQIMHANTQEGKLNKKYRKAMYECCLCCYDNCCCNPCCCSFCYCICCYSCLPQLILLFHQLMQLMKLQVPAHITVSCCYSWCLYCYCPCSFAW